MVCTICNSKKTTFLKKHTCYVEGENYKIYKCLNCNSHFIKNPKTNNFIYEKIYNKLQLISNYEVHKNIHLNTVKNRKTLINLCQLETNFYCVYQNIKNKQNLKILEVGCGLGYLSYAMAKSDRQVTAIDISQTAINYTNNNFQLNNLEYICSNLENFKTYKKFDLIVAVEVFEHIPYPINFVKLLKSLLTKNGKILILITTPNKDFCDSIKKDFIWGLEMPPVHTCMVTKKGIKEISKKLNLDLKFINVNKNLGYRETSIINFLTIKTGFLNKPKIIINEQKNRIIDVAFKLVLFWKFFKSSFFKTFILKNRYLDL